MELICSVARVSVKCYNGGCRITCVNDSQVQTGVHHTADLCLALLFFSFCQSGCSVHARESVQYQHILPF